MAILSPSDDEAKNLPPEQPIMVDSDAPDNAKAIQEIEQWCRRLGLVRIQENWLRAIRQGERTIRRGTCYRPSGDWLAQRQERLAELTHRVSVSPVTISSVDLLKEG